ncbi:MAG: hypothetical protein AAGA77_21560 [Bacteroidota bacterium]
MQYFIDKLCHEKDSMSNKMDRTIFLRGEWIIELWSYLMAK